ncbi:host specificity protein J, partial [Pokkaliibacter sp. CJK22405]|uniref:host specificity protein J n=1 Tax=Pokkaliibacter sp. CJK22405 TaxID=3384615 RepID=UPI0039847BBF
MTATLTIKGRKGGKGGGAGAVAKEDPNTLQSQSFARIIDLIAEGEIDGLVNGLQSIYLDKTPLANGDGSLNFEGVSITTREGLPTQEPIPGFPAVEAEEVIGVQIKKDAPITRTISDLETDAARIKIQIPALAKQDTSTGDLHGASVEIMIEVRPSNGSWEVAARDTISGKTTSTYEAQYRVELNGTGPWDIRVSRVTADSSSSALRNDTHWSSYTRIIDAKLSYPDSALVALEVDSAQFGTTIPNRTYHIRGRKIAVPSNYDPETRTYSGLWDGTFKTAYCNNPAWVFYDVATNVRFGAGIPQANKWSLYEIAQYCDELVPDGLGGTEPRFVINAVIKSATEAYTLLNSLASVFRGMTYWGTSEVVAVQDRPADPKRLVAPANVLGGEFKYSGTDLKSRHTTAHVTYSDPENFFESAVVVYQDDEKLRKYGENIAEVTAFGVSSKSQALRVGRWLVDSEWSEKEALEYTAGTDHASVRPGDVVAVADPLYAGARLGGRIVETGLDTLTLDAAPELPEGEQGTLYVTLPDGEVQAVLVTEINGAAVSLAEPLAAEPVKSAMYLLASASVQPRSFRVIGVTEAEGNQYTISALEHDATKYARVEQGIQLEQGDFTILPTGTLKSPGAVSAEAYTYLAGGVTHQGLMISWVPADDARVVQYLLEVKRPGAVAWEALPAARTTSTDVLDAINGDWLIRVRSMSGTGALSAWSDTAMTIGQLLLPAAPSSVSVYADNFSLTLNPTIANPRYGAQEFEFWRSDIALQTELITSNAVLRSTGSSLVDAGLTPDTQYYYYVRGVNAYGQSGFYPVQAKTSNDADGILRVLSEKITAGQLDTDLREKVDAIDMDAISENIEAAAGSLKELIDTEENERIAAINAEQQARVAALQAEHDARETGDGELSARIDEQRETSEGFALQLLALKVQQQANAASAGVEQSARVTDDQANSTRIEEVKTDFDEQLANVTQTQTAHSDELASQAQLITEVTAIAQGNSAAIQEEQTARADAIQAQAEQINALRSDVDDASASLVEERQTRATADEAISSSITSLQSAVDDNAADIQSEQTARTDADSALSARVDTVQASANDNAALLQAEQTARADADSALSARVDTVQASANDNAALLQA